MVSQVVEDPALSTTVIIPLPEIDESIRAAAQVLFTVMGTTFDDDVVDVVSKGTEDPLLSTRVVVAFPEIDETMGGAAEDVLTVVGTAADVDIESVITRHCKI